MHSKARQPKIVAGGGYSRLLLVASVVFGHLFAIIHGASTEHILCADHGLEHNPHSELVRVDSALAGSGHDHGPAELAHDEHEDHGSHEDHGPGEDHGPDDESGHDLCDIVLGSPASDVPKLDVITAPLASAVLDGPALASFVLAAIEPTYRLAPKASPPLHG